MDTLVQSKATLKTPAYAAKQANAALTPWSIERREPGPHDVLIDILYCGVCHSDLHQVKDEWHNSIFPMVPGHEIVGTVRQGRRSREEMEAGPHRRRGLLRRFLPPLRGVPRGRGAILRGQACRSTYNGYEQDKKTPTYGGYSTRITVDENYILSIPKGIPLERAAPLLCAGITTYSPLKHFGLEAGDKLGVVGLGGLGHMAVKFGHALGAHVTVLSHSPGKRDDALALGADDFLVTKDEAVFKRTPTVSISSSTRSLPRMTTTPISTCSAATASWCWWESRIRRHSRPFPLIVKRRSLAGSMIGGIRETQEMLDFCGRNNVAADVEVIPIQEINSAYERMLKNDVRYRFVIDLASLKAGAP